MGAAGVIADHAPEGAPGVGGGVGPEGQPVPLGRPAQVVQHDSRFGPGQPPVGIDFEDAGHVARHVDDDCLVARLPGQARTGAASQERRPGLGGQPGHGLDVGVVDGEDDPERDIAVVRRVGGVSGPGRVVEADFAPERAGKRRTQGSALRARKFCRPSGHLRGTTKPARVAP